jgi:hypothetical protein
MAWLVATLAAWRLTSILHREEIASFIRSWVGIREEEGLLVHPETFLGKLFGCFWCLSVWVSAGCFLVAAYEPLILMPFAISTVVIFLEEKFIP